MSLNDKLFSIASSAVEKQRKTRDSRSAASKGFDVATNKSYVNEDKKVAAKALREWENKTWKPKVEAKLKQELRARAPHLKPGSPKYNQTYENLFNKNYKDLQAAKAEAQQKIGTLRKPKQTQRDLDNEYRTNESIRNETVGVQAASHAARDTVSAVGGALATGTSRLLRAPLQLAADVGDNDDGGIFDRGAKALEGYEDNISNNVYQAYGDIQQNGNFSQKLAVSAVEQVPALAASFGAAGVAAKGVQAVGAGAKATAAASYGVAGASMYPQAYLDGSDSTKDELENATSEQLASAERSQDIYKGMFDKNVKAGMSEDEAHAKARDQTISEIAEESGENVGLATLALSMMAPGVGSFTANRAAGGAVSQWGQKVFNKLAVRADAGKVAGAAIPTAVGAGIVGLNVAEEGLQEGYTDLVAQQAAVDVGVKEEIDRAQSTEAVLMGGILGGLMGGGTYVGTRNSKFKQAQDGLKAAQQNYADIASTIPQLQEQITAVSPRSAEGQALTTQLEQTKAALSAMASEAESRGIPRTSLARRAPRIDPSNSIDQEFDGQVDGATELDEQGFDAALNPQATPVQPVVDSQPSEQELDAQDAQIAELIAEQQALDEAIDDDSAGKPVEESLAAAQAWYDDKRGENKQGLSGVISRAAAKVEDAAFSEQQQAIAGTGATINEYIAAQRTKQQQIDAEIEQIAADAKTERERQAAEQLKQQREIERAEAEAAIAKRAELAQPYENESFDTTVVGADGTPFNLARFWDSNMPGAVKAKAIADAFGGQVEQNVAKADWASLPEGVQKQLHQWMTAQLDAVRQSRAGSDTQSQAISEPPLAPASEQVAPTASSLTMPVRAEQTPVAPVEAEPQTEVVTPAAPVETDAATQLTDESPTINIPAPTQAKVDAAPTTDEGIYKSKPAAKAAIKKQKLDPNSVTINQVKGGGFEIVANAPAKPSYAQAQQQAATELGMTLDKNGEYGGTDAEFEAFAERVDEIQGRTLGDEKSTPGQTSEADKQTSEADKQTSEALQTSSENRSPEVQNLASANSEVAIKDRKDAELAKKHGFEGNNRLDHGELSIPNRTKNIDNELDKYKADKAKLDAKKRDEVKAKNTEKADAEKARLAPIQEQAQAEYKQYGTAMVSVYKDRLEAQGVNARDFIRDEAKYNPESFLKLSKKFQEEQQAATQAPAEVAAETKKPATKKADKPAATTEPVTEIEDFGEKITGARKDMESFYQKEITDDDILSQPLSKIWPKKDIDAIEDKKMAALATVLRGTIPNKPRKGYKLNNWVAQVKSARGIMQQMLSDDASAETFIDQMTKVKGLQSTGYHAQLLSAIEQDQWSRVTAVDHRPYYAIQNDDGSTSPDMSFDVTIDKRRHIIPTENKQISEVVDKVNELLSGEVKTQALKFDLYSRGRGDKRSYFITQASDKDKTPLIEFNDRDAARAFLRDNNNDLSELWNQHKEKVNVKKTDTRSRKNRERIGPDHRGGQDVTTEQFMEAFGLRGGQFGSWVKQGANTKERQGMLNDTYDAFMDLANLLNIPSEAIGLGGKLGMSFGARGKGAAMAHYEPSQVVINLTKTKGAGTLAHEWFHALDHHFTSFRDSPARNKSREDTYITYKPEPSMMYTPQKGRGYLISKPALEKRRAKSNDLMYNAENWAPDPNHPAGVRPKVEEAFADLVNALNDSPMKERASTIDKGATDGYWSRIIERAARAFESYVINKLDKQGARSDFLANVTPEDAFPRNMDRYPYLLESEMAPVAEAFDNLFATIDSRASEDGNGKTLFSRAGQMKQIAKDIKNKPAKGLTGTTSQQVISLLQDRFGKEAVAQLIKAGKLRVRALNDFVDNNGRLLIPSDAEGFYHQGKVVLIADNLKSDTAVATLLHELGGHAGIQSMLSTQTYMGLMENFYDLVKSGNKYAVRAKQRAEASTYSASEARDEYIPYLITEYSQATERGGPLAVIKRFVSRVMAGVRAWVRANTGVELRLTPNDITQLAERMVKRLAEQQSMDSVIIAGMDNTAAMPQYSQETDARFSQVEAPQSQVDEVRKRYEGTDEWMKAPNGEDTNLNEQQWLQVRTPAFKKWFGDWENDPDNASKVVDKNGEPMPLSHTTKDEFTEFKKEFIGARWNYFGKGFYFALRKSNPKEFGNVEMKVFIKSQNPYYADMSERHNTNTDKLQDEGYDSVIVGNTFDDKAKYRGYGSEYVVFEPTQIKSATDNAGTFDPSNNDIRFSRRYSSLGTDGKPTTAKERARDRLALAQATTMSSKFGINLLLRRHLATPQHVALLNPIFKIFTDNVQARIAYENNEAGLVQSLLPEIWDTRLIMGKKKEAMERVSKAIFDGTMADKVWSDTELQTMFDLTDQDIDFYRRTRQAIDESVLNMTIDTLSSLAKGTKLVNINTVGRLKLARLTPDGHSAMLQQYMTDELEKLAKGGLISAKAEARMQKQLNDVFDVMSAVAGKSEKLAEQGYAPLMRFGNYAVEVRDKTTNELDLFELHETKGQQRKAIKELKERYDENQFEIGTGTLNPEGFKQFKNKGLSPETVQLFAAELGLDEDGAHQAYLKIAISDRSALKRLIHRKKVPGYSEDMPRVLSSFVMSNARYSGRSLYNGEIERSIQNIEDGNLQNEAQKVFENMENPQEEFAQQRSMMFFYFMGFSPAFFFLNLTQPVTQTIPKLTAYVGVGKSHAYMAQALGIVGKHMTASAINMGKNAVGIPTPNWKGFEDNLPAWVKKEDYLRMAREGHLDPQNIFMIKGLERGKGGVASGVWGNIEAAAGWFAEVSESINRRSTMIAALRVAKDMSPTQLKAKGFDNKYDFAVSVIQQTQGIYNKANRSGLARGNGKLGQYGPLILVFKQFTINYTEQMIRHGRDKEAKSIAVAMAWQFGLAGMLGLPFADDLRDIVEGLLYRLFGKAFNLPDYLEGLLGKSNADALMYGIASEKGRIDLFGRSSLGNIIPGTDVARPGPTDWAEILGASSGFYESFFSAAAMATEGHYKDALITASPRFVRDAASGVEIAMTGSYRNTKGDKIMDLDKTDAVIKSLAFNPANNAKPGRDRSNAYNMKNMLKAKTDYFSKHLAEAIYQDDDARIDQLYNEMDEWNDKNAEHFNVDIDKIETSAEKRVERKDFGSAERQNIQDSLAERQEDLAGT